MERQRYYGQSEMAPRGSVLGKVAMVFGGLLLVVAVTAIGGCMSFIGAKNEIVQRSEAQKASVSEVQNQYKRRADLIPGLVAIVKGAAAHEEQVLKEVTEARAKATATNIDVTKLANDPEAQKKFLEAQQALSAAMTRMFTMVNERYPQVAANENFKTLQKQYEGTENRIAVARTDNSSRTKEYNTFIQQGIMAPIVANMYGYNQRDYFKATEAEQAAPTIDFNKK